MSVEQNAKPQYRYDDTGMFWPYGGYWDVRVVITGDGVAGTQTARVVPSSPRNRIFVIEYVFCNWQTVAGSAAAASIDLIQSASQGNMLLAVPDMSGATRGVIPIEFPMGIVWQSFNTGDVMLSFVDTNKDSLALQISAGGRFYEGKGRFQNLPGLYPGRPGDSFPGDRGFDAPTPIRTTR